MYGEIAQHVITGRSDEFIQERINYYIALFGKEGFYLELQEHPDRALQPKINEEFVRFSREYGYEIVGTNNSYYMAPEDAEPRDLMACVADGRPLDDPDRPTLM
jgi:DNA polymerase-3 subunit alpha